ncbi:MAG: hypothetical protein ACLQVD_00860 [Capsulimonadaceae bacterium]
MPEPQLAITTPTKTILYIEDEPLTMQYHIGVLKDAGGFHVTVCRRSDDAVWEYDKMPYDAVVLDIMMPPPSALTRLFIVGSNIEHDTGLDLYKDIRARGIIAVPIIVLSNRNDLTELQWAYGQTKPDERLAVYRKVDLRPHALVSVVTKMIADFPIDHSKEMNSRPYFALDCATGKEVRMDFSPATSEDCAALEVQWNGDFHRGFVAHLNDSSLRGHILKLERRGVHDGRIHGLLDAGRDGAVFNAIMQAAPEHRYGATNRQLCSIGRVLVARLIRESIFRGSQGRVALGADVVKLYTGGASSSPFLEAVGFRRTEAHRMVYSLNERDARRILDKVCP